MEHPLKVGQTLWWVKHANGTEGTVTVTRLGASSFWVLYQGEEKERPYSILGEKLFFTSQLPKTESEPPVKSCENCFLRHSRECTSLSNIPCEDFRQRTRISREEMADWPTHGDATEFRMKKQKPIIKEKW